MIRFCAIEIQDNLPLIQSDSDYGISGWIRVKDTFRAGEIDDPENNLFIMVDKETGYLIFSIPGHNPPLILETVERPEIDDQISFLLLRREGEYRLYVDGDRKFVNVKRVS